MATIHVWGGSKNPLPRYPDKEHAAVTIANGLAVAQPGDTVLVHGDAPPYAENVVVPRGGIALRGHLLPIIDGGNLDRAVTLPSDEPALTVVSGFEIRNGSTTQNGGGVWARDSSVVIEENCIHDNSALKLGGGVCLEYSDSAKYPRASYAIGNRIHSNQAAHGGGVAAVGVTLPLLGAPSNPVVFLRNNVIGPDNKARGNLEQGVAKKFVHGGGVAIYRLPAMVDRNEILKNATASASVAEYGGGACVFNIDQNTEPVSAGQDLVGLPSGWTPFTSQVTLRENFVHDNDSARGAGVAGIWGAQVYYLGNRIDANVARVNGGGVYATTRSRHTFLSDNAVRFNRTLASSSPPGTFSPLGNGGGMYASCFSLLQLAGNNLVFRNTAWRRGGGICVENADLEATGQLEVQQNTGGLGGGIGSYMGPKGDYAGLLLVSPSNLGGMARIEGAIIDRNVSYGPGGGVSVLRLEPGGASVSMRGCLFTENVTQGPDGGSGLSIRRDAAITSTFEIVESRFARHRSRDAVMILDYAPNKSSVVQNHFEDNVIDLAIREKAEVEVANNVFRGSEYANVTTARTSGSVRVTGNEFDGRQRTRYGISAHTDLGAMAPSPLTVERNNFHDHAYYGATLDGGTGMPMAATDNWWGDPAGPRVPGSSSNGDSVSEATVAFKPYATQPFPVSVLATSWTPVRFPDLSPPRAIDCERGKGRSVPDEPPELGALRPPDEVGTYVLLPPEPATGSFIGAVAFIDEEPLRACLLHSGDAILVNDNGSPSAYLTPRGDFWAVAQPTEGKGKPPP